MTRTHLQETTYAATCGPRISDFHALHTWWPLITATTPPRSTPTPDSPCRLLHVSAPA
ncbi:hypothetical protein [Streptomyces avermitilis]|uniref:hypothetical protein n=1 Tax=Streptomyces avermitilis TaxID=33903 RepID=UPI0033A4EAB0